MSFKGVKPTQPLWEKLRLSGSMPGEANGVDAQGKKRQSDIGGAGAGGLKKKKGGDGKSVDMDKLAEGLQKLGEDDLLQVVQMVHDNKSEDSWMRNDVERKSRPLPLRLPWSEKRATQCAHGRQQVCMASQRTKLTVHLICRR
jgi:transcription initiation factor TFIID/TFIIF subunit